MKRSAFIFALFYLLSAVGYGVELHYCLGQVTDVNIAWLDTSCSCDAGEKKVAPPCCDKKEFFVQIEEDHQASKTQSPTATGLFLLVVQSKDMFDMHETVTTSIRLPEQNGPPLDVPLFERFCARLIYS